MAFLDTKRLHLTFLGWKVAGSKVGRFLPFQLSNLRPSNSISVGRATPSSRGIRGQWFMVGVVSVILGLAILGASALPSKYAPFFLAAVLLPLVLLIVGDVKRFFLAVMILDIPLQIDT